MRLDALIIAAGVATVGMTLAIQMSLSWSLQPAASQPPIDKPEIAGVSPNPAAPSATAQTLTVSGRNYENLLSLVVTTPAGRVVTYSRIMVQRRDAPFRASVILDTPGTYVLAVHNPDGTMSRPFTIAVRASAASSDSAGLTVK